MPNMDTVRRGTAAGVQIERLAALIAVEDELKVAVGEDNAAAEKVVWAFAGDTLEAL